MGGSETDNLIYDWNEQERKGALLSKVPRFVDESIRDGIQSPSVRDPSIDQKMEIVRLMDSLGIHVVNLGLPAAGKRAQDDVEALLRMIVEEKLSIRPNCAARTVVADIEPIVEISQRVGMTIEVTAFIGSSPIRAYTENWETERLVRHTREAMSFVVRHGLPASFVTEDTTRSHPNTLEKLFRTALEAGATRLVLCDTVGHATPDGLRNLVGFTQNLLSDMKLQDSVELDWHGHNDRGLALPLAILAFELGVDRVHGCALGIGERVGNTSMDLLLLNLDLLGQLDPAQHDLSRLVEYVSMVASYTGVPIHPSYPLSGEDAFRTATGVHAAAIIKAQRLGDRELADRVYSSVPARRYGRAQVIEVGHYSGRSNVICWLSERSIEPNDDLVEAILGVAKKSDHTMSEAEIRSVIAGRG